MDWISFITTMFSLGCDVTGYVGYVRIIGVNSK